MTSPFFRNFLEVIMVLLESAKVDIYFLIYLFGCTRSYLQHVASFFSCGTWILSYSMWNLVPWPGIESQPPTLGVQSLSTSILSYSMWNLVPWPGIESRPPALRVQSLSHWTTREVPWPRHVLTLLLSEFYQL